MTDVVTTTDASSTAAPDAASSVIAAATAFPGTEMAAADVAPAVHPTLVGLLDGRVVSADAPLLRPDDAGVVRGDGVFETTLVVRGVPRDLPEHLARLDRSAAMIDLVIPGHRAWHTGIDAVLAGWTGADMVLRLTATRGPEHGAPTCFVTGSGISPAAVTQRTSGVRVLLLERGFAGSAVSAAPWLLPGAKTLSYAVNMAALRYAAGHEADDVIFVGSDGTVLEAPTATVVIARGRSLLTPPPAGVLDGITVGRLFVAAAAAGRLTGHQVLTPADLRDADGVWLASSVRLLAPVTHLDGVALSGGPSGDDDATAELLDLLDA